MAKAFDAALRVLFGSALLAVGCFASMLALFGHVPGRVAVVAGAGALVGLYSVWTAADDSHALRAEHDLD